MTIFAGQSSTIHTSTGNLPFTGQDLLLYAIIAAILILGGFVLKALASRHA